MTIFSPPSSRRRTSVRRTARWRTWSSCWRARHRRLPGSRPAERLMRLSRIAALVVLAVATSAGPLRSQTAPAPGGSRYLPLDHWAYQYVTRLRERGYLGNLNPLAQPYRRLEVARG